MGKVSGNPMTTRTMVHRLRLMADAGGVLTRDRCELIIQAADKLEDLNERVAIMTEQESAGQDPAFPSGGYESDGNG